MENEETLLALDKVFAKYGAVRENGSWIKRNPAYEQYYWQFFAGGSCKKFPENEITIYAKRPGHTEMSTCIMQQMGYSTIEDLESVLARSEPLNQLLKDIERAVIPNLLAKNFCDLNGITDERVVRNLAWYLQNISMIAGWKAYSIAQTWGKEIMPGIMTGKDSDSVERMVFKPVLLGDIDSFQTDGGDLLSVDGLRKQFEPITTQVLATYTLPLHSTINMKDLDELFLKYGAEKSGSCTWVIKKDDKVRWTIIILETIKIYMGAYSEEALYGEQPDVTFGNIEKMLIHFTKPIT